jgi:hypothetical protein
VAVAAAFCQPGVPDLLFHGGRFMGDIRAAGMAGSGCALPSGPLSVYANPSLVHSYAKGLGLRGLLSAFSYEQQGPLYDGHVVTTSAGYYAEKKGTVVNMYRYLHGNDDEQTDYQTSVVYANQLFESGDRQGAVDIGIAMRYEQSNWNTYGLPARYRYTYEYDTLPARRVPTPLDTSMVSPGSILEKRLLFDLGFFQPHITPNLDFALVLHNLFGYAWNETRPWVEPVDVVDSTGLDTAGERYVDEYVTDNGWIDGWYRRMTLGVLFYSDIVKNRFMVRVPLELEFIGLFQRGHVTHTMFRCGVEIEFRSMVLLRVGYGREPELLEKGADPENRNVFTGGVGFHYRGLAVESCFGTDLWGLGVSFCY